MKNIMLTSGAIAAALTLIATPALAQKKVSPRTKAAANAVAVPAIPPVCPLATGETLVTLLTSQGPIELALDVKRAPITAGNFLKYVDQKRMDGAIFYRVVKMGDGSAQQGLVQGGQRNPGKLLPPIAHEPTNVTGLSNVAGAISMARAEPGTATSDFFIMVSDLTSLDADPSKPGDNQGYAAFGHVTKGMDVARQIHAQPIDPAKGPMVGQMLASPITVTAVRRTPLLDAHAPSCHADTSPAAAPSPAPTAPPQPK